MKQREIKIPLSCKNALRLLATVFTVLWITVSIHSLSMPIHDIPENLLIAVIFIIIAPLIIWASLEVGLTLADRVLSGKPILPFKFKCKCDDI